MLLNLFADFFFFFFENGVLKQVFMLAKQALYRLSHTSSAFCSGYFEDRVYLLDLALNLDPPDLSLPSS
jgi:hypothetical protein